MDNLNYWPYTNIHELNLDWIIAKIKELDTRFTDDIETFVQEYINEHFAEWTVNANYDPDDETIIYTNGTGATLTAGEVKRFAIDNAYVNVKDTTARASANNAASAAANAQSTANSATTAAAAAQSTADNAVTAAAAAQSTADTNTTAISALDTKIEAHIPVLWNLVSSGYLSAGAQNKTIISGRKLSDFNMLIIQWFRYRTIRESMIVTTPQLSGGNTCELVDVDSSNTQRWIDITYVSDTEVTITASSNIGATDQIIILGVGSIHTEG